jgi:hypothetical protein
LVDGIVFHHQDLDISPISSQDDLNSFRSLLTVVAIIGVLLLHRRI